MFAVAGYHAVVCDAFICFSFESHFYEYGGSKFHHIVGIPAIVLPGGGGGESTLYIGYKRLCKKTHLLVFPRENTRGEILLHVYSQFSGRKFF